MFKFLLIVVPFLVVSSNGLDPKKFLKENCDLSYSYRITCSFVHFQEEDSKEIQLKKFIISNASRVEFQNSKFIAFFEKFPNAVEFSFRDSNIDLTEKTQRYVEPHASLNQLTITDSIVDNWYYEKGLESLTKLRYLYFDRVSFRWSFNNAFFQQMPQLQIISIQNCGVLNIAENTFSGLSQLNTLRLNGVAIPKLTSYVFSGLGNLGTLEWVSSGIEHISTNALPSSLWSLTLRNNSIGFVSRNMFSKSISLSHLDLSDNNITIVSQNAFSNVWTLRYLYLQNNKIKTFTRKHLEGNKGLLELDISDNKIADITNDFADDLVNVFQILILLINLLLTILTNLILVSSVIFG